MTPTVAKSATVQTWFKTALEGTQIFPVTVLKVNPTTLLIRTDTGAEDTVQRDDPAVSYWPTCREAEDAVEARLERAWYDASNELHAFRQGRQTTEPARTA